MIVKKRTATLGAAILAGALSLVVVAEQKDRLQAGWYARSILRHPANDTATLELSRLYVHNTKNVQDIYFGLVDQLLESKLDDNDFPRYIGQGLYSVASSGDHDAFFKYLDFLLRQKNFNPYECVSVCQQVDRTLVEKTTAQTAYELGVANRLYEKGIERAAEHGTPTKFDLVVIMIGAHLQGDKQKVESVVDNFLVRYYWDREQGRSLIERVYYADPTRPR